MSEKKKHKGESIIGKIIYATLLFMPLMSIFVRSMYVVVNKNAYQSYESKYVERYNEVNNTNVLVEGNEFEIIYNNDATATASPTFQVNDTDAYKFLNVEGVTITSLAFINETYARVNIGLSNGTTVRVDNWNTISNKIWFTLKSTNYNLTTGLPKGNLYFISYAKNTLDNVFQESIEKVEQNSMYNWTTSTGTYDVINRTTTGLGIQNSFVDLLLTYWILLTIIYIIYDIGLCLVMMAHRKVHSLIDSVD